MYVSDYHFIFTLFEPILKQSGVGNFRIRYEKKMNFTLGIRMSLTQICWFPEPIFAGHILYL